MTTAAAGVWIAAIVGLSAPVTAAIVGRFRPKTPPPANGGVKTDIAVLETQHTNLRKLVEQQHKETKESIKDLRGDMSKRFGELATQLTEMRE